MHGFWTGKTRRTVVRLRDVSDIGRGHGGALAEAGRRGLPVDAALCGCARAHCPIEGEPAGL